MDDSGMNFIATPWLWYGEKLPKPAGSMCVVAFKMTISY